MSPCNVQAHLRLDHDFGEFNCPCRGKGIALDVARGLFSLHSRRIVHLDVKSPNVLLTQEYLAKLSDVGRACFCQFLGIAVALDGVKPRLCFDAEIWVWTALHMDAWSVGLACNVSCL